ncbi:ABC transporter permease subunit [Mycoplasma hafezii]|uniref:ABC transporter permease n=1 Tax=Mycoplasma hafezii TaxID=525886 RepID=UPI003CEEB5AA
MNAIKNELYNTRKFLMFDDRVKTRRKSYASLWAVAIGLLAASVIYFIMVISGGEGDTVNPFTFLVILFKNALAPDELSQQKFLSYFLVFAFAGIGVAIGFKSGLFNIGIAGQMQLPAIIFFVIIITNNLDLNHISMGYLIGMIFVFVIIGMAVGAISGFLKAFFNVHEVISTIFLNWIITYLGVWLFTRTNNVFANGYDYLLEIAGTQGILLENSTAMSLLIAGVVILIVAAISMWYIYQRTTLGYKIKMVGLNKTNSKYVGINEKLTTISIMGIAGAFSGLAGYFYTVVILHNYPATDTPDPIGFESIAVALIALNSPIGVIFSGLLYSVIYSGKDAFQLLDGAMMVGPDFFPIINGIIIFLAALAVIFYNFKPIRGTFKFFYLLFNKEYWMNKKLLHASGKKYLRKERQEIFKLYFENKKLNHSFKKETKEYETKIAKHLLEINELDKKLKNIHNEQERKNIQSQILKIYNVIAEEKFAFLKRKESFGLNKYKDARNKYQNQVYSRKVTFNALKEQLFAAWVAKVVSSKFDALNPELHKLEGDK